MHGVGVLQEEIRGKGLLYTHAIMTGTRHEKTCLRGLQTTKAQLRLDTKTVFGVCKQQRRRPDCADAQSDQCLCYSLVGKNHT